jgi:hypothetical protein
VWGRRGLEASALLGRERQRAGQVAGHRMARAGGVGLELLDAARAEAGLLGQRLLGQAGRQAQLAEQRAEGHRAARVQDPNSLPAG